MNCATEQCFCGESMAKFGDDVCRCKLPKPLVGNGETVGRAIAETTRSCPHRALNAAGEDVGECGDEGLCESCQDAAAREHSYLRGLPRYAVMGDELARQEYEADMRDAGRLVAP